MSPREAIKSLLRVNNRAYRSAQAVECLVRYYTRTLHEPEFEVFGRFTRGTVLDIGANIGQSALSISALNPNLTVRSFEANPMCEPLLRFFNRLIGPRHSYDIVGVSDTLCERQFFVPIKNGVQLWQEGSFDRTSFGQPATLARIGQRFDIIEMRSKTLTVDSLATNPVAIKIDVQGSEMNVLRGAAETLHRSRPLLLIERGPDEDAISKMLFEAYGYRREHLGAKCHESDCVNLIYSVP